MKARIQCRQVLSLILTLALLLGMLPTTVFAFTPGEDVNVIEFKAMTLDNLAGGPVSDYQYLSTKNTFYNDINMNGYTDDDGVMQGYS